MFAFLASDAGLLVAWLLLVLGAADIAIGWLWFGRGRAPKELAEATPRLRRWVPLILLFDALLVAVGIYGLRMHGLF